MVRAVALYTLVLSCRWEGAEDRTPQVTVSTVSRRFPPHRQSHSHTNIQIQTEQSLSQASAKPPGTVGRTAFQLPEGDHLEL